MKHRTSAHSWLQVVCLVSACFHPARAAMLNSNNASNMVYDWDKLAPSTVIGWTPCFDSFTCTRLEVPLDYGNPSVGKTTIAFMRYPAAIQPAKDLLLNFGGPGGSGVGQLKALYPVLTQIYGSTYNLIGFDPRGVNNSGISLDCFPGDPITRNNFDLRFYRHVSDANSESIAEQYHAADAWGQWCNKAYGGSNGTGRYANTPAVATDMLTYAEAQSVANNKSKEEAKVYYSGYSYGTALGATFASMFPDRIGRLILDGVVDAENYYTAEWSDNLLDADAAVESFFQFCYDAGPDACPLYEPSVQKIGERFSKVFVDLKANPVPVVQPELSSMPFLATYSDLKNALLLAPYFPLSSFPQLAQILVDLENGNGTSLAIAQKLYFGFNNSNQDLGWSSIDPGLAIGCIDGYGSGRNNITASLENTQEYLEYLMMQSKWVGDAWGWNALNCKALDVEPPASGKMNVSLPSAKNTSFPILFISNTIDPVTPIAAARKMSAAFPGSILLENNGVGHTAALSAPSNCTLAYIQKYLNDGTLPQPDTICQPNTVPFKGEVWPGVTELGQ